MKTRLLTALFLVVLSGQFSQPSFAVVPADRWSAASSAGEIVNDVTYSFVPLSNGTVRFSMQNNSMYGLKADIIRESLTYPTNGEIITEFFVASGSAFVYIDDLVVPGNPYMYVFEYTPEGTINWIINFDYVTPFSEIPALGNFSLIASSTSEEYDVLHNDAVISIDNTNIRADASNDGVTASVVFYLNGKRSVDNTFPFSLFGDVRGDYKKGRLKNGSHALTAIAYPEKNGKGIPGDTTDVTFSVDIQYEDLAVMVYPNPVREGALIHIEGDAGSAVTVEIVDQTSLRKVVISEGRLGANGVFEHRVSAGEFAKGVYLLRVRLPEVVIQQRVVFE